MIFWINLPLGVLAYAMTSAKLRRLPRHERPHQLDFVGAALLVSATAALLLVLNWGGVRYAWASPQIGLFGAGFLIVLGLFVWRVFRAPEPFIPLSVLANPVVRAGTLSACFGMGTFIGLSVFVPMYFENVYHLSASRSGLALVPFMVGTVSGATLSGRSLARTLRYKRLPLFGLSMSLGSALLLALVREPLPMVALQIVLTALSLGLGTILPVCTVTIQNAVKPHELGTATGAANFFRQLGGAISVAAFGAIILGGVAALGGALGQRSEHGHMAISGIGAEDFAHIFRFVFAAAAVQLALALTWMVVLPERPLRGALNAPASDEP